MWLSEIGDKDRITVEEFCEGRKNKIAYNLFYTKFVPAIVGPELFRQRIKDLSEHDLCTASDEAFTLLLIENSYARWVSIYDKSGGIPSQRRGDTKRSFDSDIEAKYTRGGIKLSCDKTSQKRKGWTPEGITRFNTLFAQVRRDKTRRPKFDARLIKRLRESPDKKCGQKKRKYETILAAHSLWEADEPDANAKTDSEDSDNSGGDSDGGNTI